MQSEAYEGEYLLDDAESPKEDYDHIKMNYFGKLNINIRTRQCSDSKKNEKPLVIQNRSRSSSTPRPIPKSVCFFSSINCLVLT